MALIDFKKPQWLHNDPAERKTAVGRLDPADTEILARIARDDENREVRLSAVARLASVEVLEQLAAQHPYPEDLPQISDRQEQLLHEEVLHSRDIERGRRDIALIASPDRLADIAANAELAENRLAAVARIDDPMLLCRIVEQKCGKEPAKAALTKIDSEELLERLSTSAASKTARRIATEKLAEIELARRPPDPEEHKAKILAGLAAEAGKMLSPSDWDEAAGRLSEIRQQWRELDGEGRHPDHREFAASCQAFEEKYRNIREHRQAEQAKAEKYEKQQAKLDAICATIEGLIGSKEDDAYRRQQKAAAEWQSLMEDPAERMVPSEAITRRFAQACRSFLKNNEKIDAEKKIFAVLGNNLERAATHISAGKLKEAGRVLAEAEKELAARKFKYLNPASLQDSLKEAVLGKKQAEKEILEQNLARRDDLCRELEKLAEAESPDKVESQVQGIRDRWQQIPGLNPSDSEAFEIRFQKALEKFTANKQAFHHNHDWQLWANLTLKEKLADRVEQLDQEDDLGTVINTIKEAQKAWKDIGPIPHKVSKKLWERFHRACDRNYIRGTPYLEELKNKKNEAMARRNEICREAEELAESADWQKTSDKLKKLQEEWKNLPHGSRRAEDKLYRRFRKACNRFFERRHENYELSAEERQRNLEKKIKLCEEAEGLGEDFRSESLGRFKELQSRWKRAGRVPKEQEQEIWLRFRGACDSFFNWLDEQRKENLKLKQGLCEELEELLGESSIQKDQREIAAKIADLQRRWKEIGPVSRDKQDSIGKRFNDPCNDFFKARQEKSAREKQRRGTNQARKEELLAEAEFLATNGTVRESSAQLQDIQKEWQGLGPAPREVNNLLDNRFKELCDAFFEDRRQYFTDLENRRLENQRKKESLCLRLKNILGTASEYVASGEGKVLSLADQLKQAMQDNIMLAGRRNEQKAVRDEVRKIQQEWGKTGPGLRDHEQQTNKRFRQAIEKFHARMKEDSAGKN